MIISRKELLEQRGEFTTSYALLKRGDEIVLEGLDQPPFIILAAIHGGSKGAGGMSESHYWVDIVTDNGISIRIAESPIYRGFKLVATRNLGKNIDMFLTDAALQAKQRSAERMEAREARKAERNKLCESAIAKLTPEEIDAIGLKKGR